MKVYDVCYMSDGFHEHATVYADNKTEVRRLMRNHFGNNVNIDYIEDITR